MKSRVCLIVRGKVQGVCFRYYTKKKAIEFNLKGYVKNNYDNDTVEIVVEGNKQDIEKLVLWTNNGPSDAKVEKLDITWQEYKNEFDSFEITG
jgi:acylphosphatase